MGRIMYQSVAWAPLVVTRPEFRLFAKLRGLTQQHVGDNEIVLNYNHINALRHLTFMGEEAEIAAINELIGAIRTHGAVRVQDAY